jgi:hypothetical protein
MERTLVHWSCCALDSTDSFSIISAKPLSGARVLVTLAFATTNVAVSVKELGQCGVPRQFTVVVRVRQSSTSDGELVLFAGDLRNVERWRRRRRGEGPCREI